MAASLFPSGSVSIERTCHNVSPLLPSDPLSGQDLGRRVAPFTQPCYRRRPQCAFFETRATNSSNLESKSFRMGDSFDFLYPRTSSTVGVFPLRGRLVTDRVRKFLA